MGIDDFRQRALLHFGPREKTRFGVARNHMPALIGNPSCWKSLLLALESEAHRYSGDFDSVTVGECLLTGDLFSVDLHFDFFF